MSDETFEFTRRKILASAGAVGVAGATAGFGTSAFFSDEESFDGNSLMAGTLDMKAAYEVHYSDWSEDELDGIPAENVTMTDATNFSATEVPGLEFETPGDLEQFMDNTHVHEDGDASCPDGDDADDLTQPVIGLDDVKPGDTGEVTFDFALCDNPGYVWFEVGNVIAKDLGHTEPEGKDVDEGELVGPPGGPQFDIEVELLDVVQAGYWIDDGDNIQNGGESFASTGSLREILNELAELGGVLVGDIDASDGGGTGQQGCFSGGTQHSLGFAWWVPVDHGNEIQSDSVTFDLGFYTEQCRHNDGTGDELMRFLNAPAELKEQPIWDGTIMEETGSSEVTVDVGALTSVHITEDDLPEGIEPPDSGLPDQLAVAFDPMVIEITPGTEVTWEWVGEVDGIPHNVHATDHTFSSGPPVSNEDPPHTFTHTFGPGDVGTHLYVCHPHGGTEIVPSFLGGEVLNEFGMRGAVIVSDD